MALIIKDRVKETTTTTGTGVVTLAGAMTGFRAFSSVMANNDTCYYCIQGVDISGNPSGEWETGLGTYNSSGTTLTRTTVQDSSNAGSAVTFSAGTKQVILDVTAAYLATLATLAANTFTAAQVMSDQIVSRAMHKDCGLTYFDSTTTNALDYTNGSVQRWAPNTGAQTLSISNWPPTGNTGILEIEGVNLGAATITWPSGSNWLQLDGTYTSSVSTFLAQNGTRTAFKSSGVDKLIVETRDAGTTLYWRFA